MICNICDICNTFQNWKKNWIGTHEFLVDEFSSETVSEISRKFANNGLAYEVLKNVPRLVIDVMSLSAVEIVVDKPDAVVEIVDDITLNGSEHLFLEGLFRVLYVFVWAMPDETPAGKIWLERLRLVWPIQFADFTNVCGIMLVGEVELGDFSSGFSSWTWTVSKS